MQTNFQFVQLSKQLVFHEQSGQFQSLKGTQNISKEQSTRSFEKTCKLTLSNCKQFIFSIIQQFQFQATESLARTLINKFFVFKKSFNQILKEGILTLYIEMFQIMQNLAKNLRRAKQKQMLSQMIQAIEPLLFEHFIFKDFERRKKIILQFQQCQLKAKPLLKKMSKISNLSSQSSQKQGQIQQLNLTQQDQKLINIIKEEFRDKSLNNLLAQYLKSQTQNIDQMMQLCRICSKNVKLADLQKHVLYCQKKVTLKQQINKYTKRLQQIFLDLKCQIQNVQNKYSQPEGIKQIIEKLTIFHKKFEKKRKEKHWQSTYQINETSQSESLIQIQEELTALQMEYGSSNIIQAINTYLVVQRDIGMLCKDLLQLQQFYKTSKSIKSTTTLRQKSQNSNNLNSKCQKKSKFAEAKISTKSINSIKIQKTGSNQHQTSDRSFEIINQEGFINGNLKTKKSLGTPKIVHFNFQDCDQIKSQSQSVQEDGSKKFRSLYNLQSIGNFDDLESQSQQKEMNQLSLEDFQIIKFIGKGAFGKVYAARRKSTQDLYALKIVNIDQKWGQKELASIINEHQVFKKIEGDHLVRAPFSFGEGSTQIFMMEFMPGGDLSKLLQEQCYFEQSKAKFYLAEIVLAIEHLHKAQIIHRDLKPQNLVLDEGGHLKLTDFGLSQFQIKGKLQKVFKICSNQKSITARRRQRRTAVFPNKNEAKLIGTPDYIAPQIINGISVDNKSIDWWSLGVIAYQLMIGARPFCDNSIQQVVGNIIRYQIQWPQIGTEEGCISENAYDLISNLLNRDFINRLGSQNVNQIKNHPFFDGIDWQNIKYTKAPYIPPQNTMKKLLQMKEDLILKQQIQLMIRANNKNSKLKLENFVRYDILGQETVDSAKKSRSLKGHKLKKLESIKQSINNQKFIDQLSMVPSVRKIKKHKSYYQIHSRQNFNLDE